MSCVVGSVNSNRKPFKQRTGLFLASRKKSVNDYTPDRSPTEFKQTSMQATSSTVGVGKKKSKTSRAGLTFPVDRVTNQLKKGRYSKRVGKTAPIYLAAVLEYLTAEILELAVIAVVERKKTKILPR